MHFDQVNCMSYAQIQQNTVLTLRLVPVSLTLVFLFTCISCATLRYKDSCCAHAACGLISVVMSFARCVLLTLYLLKTHNLIAARSALSFG